MNLSRRSFIKTSLAGSAALGFTGPVVAASQKWFQPTTVAKAKANEVTKFTYHTPNCGCRCAFKCTVRDGKMSIIQPNNWTDNRFSTICLKGISEIDRVYSASRIKTPLKRVGERGEGKFVPISWEEALTEIATKLKELVDQQGGESVLLLRSSGVEHTYEFLTKLLGITKLFWPGIDIGIANTLIESIGGRYYGPTQNQITDWVYSSTIVMLGHNILETTMMDSKFFFDAKEAGAKIIVVDPNYCTTAQKADQWIQIKPGTDNALLLAMISVILDNGWYDVDYLLKNSTSPFLVREDNEQLLRLNDNGEEDVEKNPYLVWDENSNSVKPFNESGIKPKLEGSFTVDGVKVKTVFSTLRDNQQQYTVSWAADITEIDEDIIFELAKDFATRGPAVLDWGYGPIDKMGNADVVGHAGAILGALTGNIGGRIGGSVGSTSHHFAAWEAALSEYPLPPQFQEIELDQTVMPISDLRFKDNPVRAVINVGNTLQQHFANLHKTEEWLNTLDLVVTIDPFHNTSVNYSDIVLPASTAFESEYEIMNLQINRSHVLLSERVIEPLFESKSDFQIEKELLGKLGLDEYHPQTPEDWIAARLDSDDPHLKGITLETLKENDFIMRLNVPDEPWRQFMDNKYETPTQKIEMYHEKFIEDNQALPNFDEALEIHDESLLKKYPLHFTQAHSRYRLHSQFFNVEWLDQITGGPTLEINPLDAKDRNLNTGDVVEVFNDRGSFKVEVKLTEYIRPGQVRLYEGWWTENMIEGNLQNVTNENVTKRHYKLVHGPVIAYADTLVEVKKV